MNFEELKQGDFVYYVVVRNSEIVDREIKKKLVSETYEYKEADSIEIHFDDGTMIIPEKGKEHIIRGLGILTNISDPLGFSIFATSFDTCYNVLRQTISNKIIQADNEEKKLNVQMAKLCMMGMQIERMENKESIVLETIYAD